MAYLRRKHDKVRNETVFIHFIVCAYLQGVCIAERARAHGQLDLVVMVKDHTCFIETFGYIPLLFLSSSLKKSVIGISDQKVNRCQSSQESFEFALTGYCVDRELCKFATIWKPTTFQKQGKSPLALKCSLAANSCITCSTNWKSAHWHQIKY